MRDEVLVIGAGPAGLASAYYLQKANIPYRVVDRARMIASTWANLYPSLRLNTPRFVSHLPGKRLPLRYDIYPTGRQFYEYCVRYAEQHRFNIQLGVSVKRVAPEGDAWRVETDQWEDTFNAVIIASGRFGNPWFPPIPGSDEFTGTLLHASQYHGPEAFTGKCVLVVGSGPSGGDISVELATRAARPVLLSVRHDIVFSRRYPLGLPEIVWKVLIARLPERLRKPLVNRILYKDYDDLEDLGLKIAPNRQDREGSGAPVRGPELINAIRSGGVKPVAGLARLGASGQPGKGCAILDDGSAYEVDAVIFGTGYRPVLHYLDIAYEVDRDGWLLREGDDGSPEFVEHLTTAVAGYPGLYIVGRFYRGLGPLRNIRYEARDAVERIVARRHNTAVRNKDYDSV